MYERFAEPPLDPPCPKCRVLCTCDSCREDIVEGDEYCEIDGFKFHLDCLSDMTTKELLEFVGVPVMTASVCDW